MSASIMNINDTNAVHGDANQINNARMQFQNGSISAAAQKKYRPSFLDMILQPVSEDVEREELSWSAQLGWDLREFLDSFIPDWWQNEPEPT